MRFASRDRGAVPTAKRLPGLRLSCCAYVARPGAKRPIWMEPDGSNETRTAENSAEPTLSLLRMMSAAPGLIPGAFRIGAAGYLQVRSRFLHEPDAHSLSLAQSEPLPFLFWQRPAFKPQPQYWLPPQSESELQPQTWAKSRQRFVEHSPFTRQP